MACLKLNLDGPADEASEQRLVRTLEAEHGVFRVIFCHGTHGVEIDFEDDEVSIDHLLARTREAGFEAHIAG